MAGAASAYQAATASREQNSQQRAGRTRRTSADPQRAQQGATAAAAAAPAALDSLSRLQQLADASPRVTQLRRLQALANDRLAPVAQLAGGPEVEEVVQGKFATAQLQPQLQQAPRVNNTGLPDQLKSGIESLSGLSMDHVRVHFNSSQPAQLNALAYAQGSDIHLAPGQEHHLPHEAWHVVQQAQGRVRPTLQMKEGVQLNDDVGLEREAYVMGTKALERGNRFDETHRSVSMPIETAQQIVGGTKNSPDVKVANNDSAPLANGRGSAQRGGNEVQRIADQRPEAATCIVQRFSGMNEANKKRLEESRIDSRDLNMQLDHAVSQDTMKLLKVNLQNIKNMVTPRNCLFAQTKTSFAKLQETIGGDFESLNKTLINLPFNISPGFKITTGNPGSGFDPQLKMDGNKSVQTELSGYLFEFDNSARKLKYLDMPSQHQAINLKYYNKKLDGDIASALDEINGNLKEVKQFKLPTFDPDIWYEHGADENLIHVKKVSAEWLDAKPGELGGEKRAEKTLPEQKKGKDKKVDHAHAVDKDLDWELTIKNFNISKKNTALDGKEITGEDEYEADYTVEVKVKIPVACWNHIYDRHYIPTFAGDVQAINTFWKQDPIDAITQELIKPEINLLLDRRFNLRKMVEENEVLVDEPINEFVNKLFFQGSIDIDLSFKDLYITIVLKSIAPQDSGLGYAIEPSLLAQ